MLKRKHNRRLSMAPGLVAGVLLGCSFLLQAAAPLTVQVAAKAPQFVVTLPANPTTGYQWSAKKYDHSQLTLVKRQYVPSKPRLMGSGGEMQFTFARLKRQRNLKNTVMVFQYARSWEQNPGKLQSVTVHFQSER